jgi:crotonobetainyl-CoA:carnitine CoA-transferase CaiB-like acyl-CoA transferase
MDEEGATGVGIFSSLRDVRVLDFTANLVGPLTSRTLAELGADVIKVEPPTGDPARNMGSRMGPGVVFRSVNANKRSVVLDLKHDDDRERALWLGERCDVVLHNYAAGTAEKLGIAYAHFRVRNPAIIYGAISAFGTGPEGQRLGGAYDAVIQGIAGLMTWSDGPVPRPIRNLPPFIDVASSTWMTIGVLAALECRRRTGEGQLIETAMIDSAFMLNFINVLSYVQNGSVSLGQGAENGTNAAPNGAAMTSDGWIYVAASSNRLFRKFADLVDRPDLLVDPRFESSAARRANNEALAAEVGDLFSSDTAQAWLERLRRAGIPAAPINRLGAAVDERIVTERELLIGPDNDQLRLPLTADGRNRTAVAEAPALGQHTDEVMKELALVPPRRGPSS